MLTIHDSVQAIMQSQQTFGERFYATMFSGYPDIEKHFEGVNMREQAIVVTMALTIIEQYYSQPNPATHKYLQVLGSRHREKQIPKELYAQWLNALLDTLSMFHEDAWTQTVAHQWTEAIEKATRAMFEGYDQHFHV